MELTHTFTVPVGIEEAWAHFNNIAQVAECFPGAQVTDDQGDTFAGSVKVKLGPIALQYNGTGTFVEKDEAGHWFVVDAKGKDKRGNGTAGAKVRLSMTEQSATSTSVEVLTDLAITGKPAQFGRGVMQDVSDKLLGQFVQCLETRMSTPAVAESAPPAAADHPATESTGAEPPEPSDAATGADGTAETAAAPPPPRPIQAVGSPKPVSPANDDALDLGSAVLPVLAKSYWKQAVAALVVLLVVRRLLRRG